MGEPVCVVVGAGTGNGAAFARRFAADGYRVALLARDEKRVVTLAKSIPGSIGLSCDVVREESVAAAFARVEEELGPVQTLIFNAGNYVRGGIDETDAARLEDAFRVNAVGCLNATKRVVKGMRKRGGEIVVIGATASKRGSAGSLPFAAAKAGQRVMVESMARELGPQGVHVAYVVVDGVIDSTFMRMAFPCKSADEFMQPDDIALAVAQLVKQPRYAWTFELDLRPNKEKW